MNDISLLCATLRMLETGDFRNWTQANDLALIEGMRVAVLALMPTGPTFICTPDYFLRTDFGAH